LKLLPRILADEDELDREPEPRRELNQPGTRRDADVPPGPARGWVLGTAVTAVMVRLIYLFGFTDPENAGHGFTDAYHPGRSRT
jgi:hypothetical protein